LCGFQGALIAGNDVILNAFESTIAGFGRLSEAFA
jgi:hypothetical protein